MSVVGGVGGGRYSPDSGLTRAQFCVLMIRTLDELDEKELFNTHFYKTLRWLTGHEGLRAAVVSGQPLSAWYDRTHSSSKQVRVLVIEDNKTIHGE